MWFPTLVGAARWGTITHLCHQLGRWLGTSPSYCNQFAQRLHLFVSRWQEYPQSQEKRKHWISTASVISRGAVINLLQAHSPTWRSPMLSEGPRATLSPPVLLCCWGWRERWRQGRALCILHHLPAVEGFGSPELASPSAKGEHGCRNLAREDKWEALSGKTMKEEQKHS